MIPTYDQTIMDHLPMLWQISTMMSWIVVWRLVSDKILFIHQLLNIPLKHILLHIATFCIMCGWAMCIVATFIWGFTRTVICLASLLF